MIKITEYKISFFDDTETVIIPVVQGDTGRVIKFTPKDATLSASYTATWFVRKPSGNAVYYTATIVGDSVVCELTAQALAEKGESYLYVRIYDQNETVVSSFRSVLKVQESPVDAIESTTETNIFDQAVEEAVADFQTEAEQIVAEVIESIPSDYTVLSNDVTNLKQELNGVFEFESDPAIDLPWTDGYYVNINTGNPGSNQDYSISLSSVATMRGNTPAIEPNTAYTIKHTGLLYYVFYDQNYSRINGYQASASDDTTVLLESITTPSNAAYVVVSCKIINKANCAIYKGEYNQFDTLKDSVVIPQIADMMSVNAVAVNPTNYATVLPDVNNITKDCIYKLYFANGSTAIPAHLPFGRWITNMSVALITFGTNGNASAGMMQLCVGRNFVFYREYTTAWAGWQALQLEVNVGSGYQVVSHFDTLTEAVVFASQYRNAVVNVYNGTFDLYNEFLSYYGADFFTNFTANTTPKGLILSNNIHLKFSPFAKVQFNYTGDNTHVKQQFSPFNFLSGCVDGFILEGLNLECSNCRYCVHDDPSDTSRAYHNKYINCHMEIDNSENADWTSSKVIGGGLGRAGAITIKNCVFVSDNPSTSKAIVSYHNDASANVGQSKVTIVDNYLDGGTVGAFYAGTSTDKTEFVVSGNSLYGNIIKQANSASDTTDNIDVVSWNNVNRAS